jgi:hypothetical protein
MLKTFRILIFGAANSSHFNALVPLINKIDYTEVPNSYPICGIMQFLTPSRSGDSRQRSQFDHDTFIVSLLQGIEFPLRPFAAKPNLEHGSLAGAHSPPN